MTNIIERLSMALDDFMSLADYMRVEEAKGFGRVKPLTAREVSDHLTKHGHRHVIVGAHAIVHHTEEPRSTADVDVVSEDPEKAAHRLAALRPGATVRQHDGSKYRIRESPARWSS
jgi:hypothetical protein